MKIRLMTSNVWGDFFKNPVPPRAPKLFHVYQKYRPDVLGLQEARKSWQESSLFPALSGEYEQVTVDTQGRINHTPLFYLRDRFEVVASSWQLYHESIDRSKGWTEAVFREKRSGALFAVFCTHFWWKTGPEHDVIRFYNAKDIVAEMKRVAEKYACPVFFMGDLNCAFSSLAWRYLNQQGWDSAYRLTPNHSAFNTWHKDPVKGQDGEFHGSTTTDSADLSIDHVGIPSGVTVLRHCAVTDQEALDASDHSPVFVDCEFEAVR